eukprot:3907896-Pyramimonas_sp.AAC.1
MASAVLATTLNEEYLRRLWRRSDKERRIWGRRRRLQLVGVICGGVGGRGWVRNLASDTIA